MLLESIDHEIFGFSSRCMKTCCISLELIHQMVEMNAIELDGNLSQKSKARKKQK